MTLTPFDADRPPERPRRRRRPASSGSTEGRRPLDAAGKRRGAGADAGDREMSLVGDMEFESYYGRPIVKAPPWEEPIALYLFVGGVAGGSGLLALGAHASGRPGLRRAARLTALGAIGVGTPALVVDLGRPERFLNMMRTVKITSFMSMGTWILSASGAVAGVSALIEVDRLSRERLPLGPLRPALHALDTPAAIAQAGTGALLATYTGGLLGDTAVPTWSAGRHDLPLLFGSSATLASAGAALVLAPGTELGPARALAAAGVAGDLLSMHRMKASMHPLEAEPLETGRAGRRLRWAERLAVAGGVGAVASGLLSAGAGTGVGRSRVRTAGRVLTAASGLALLGASALTRFGVLEAGLESVKDPRRVVEPQKARLAARRAAGTFDDSITTGA
ncbi:polysulfide reductase NrfD [Brachybacterium rhamnosum]|uniref:NrfD/PsrC family molybdoenzyme membrane anchor subunit n=1 Tax=Brachybacterium rhamnosum TaxID=173361 RepID=A0ABW4PUP5_9MICO|nr:NrfD/PsrC family molybdoenzyme membrane anchor subunit [Brachybacterium sp. SGAir0954]QCR54596.1 nitrite reductase [Brachybacterium sp. SGAir0954]